MAVAGTLEIQMMASMARLQTDMTKGVSIVSGATAKMESAVASAKSALGALGLGLSAAGVAAVGMRIADLTSDIIKATAALDDMAEQTGATVERLSALRTVTSIGGHDFGGITEAIGKMIKGLKGTDEEGQAAGQALDFLGIKAKDGNGKFRDSVVILQDVAKALSKYEDGGNKIALLQDLLGKSGAKYASLLKDMAEEGETQAKVTTKQAAEAETLEKNWNRLKIAGDDWRRGMVMGITPELIALTERMITAQKEGRTLAQILTEAAKAAGMAGKWLPGPYGTISKGAGALGDWMQGRADANRGQSGWAAIGFDPVTGRKLPNAGGMGDTGMPTPSSLAYESAKKAAGGAGAKAKVDTGIWQAAQAEMKVMDEVGEEIQKHYARVGKANDAQAALLETIASNAQDTAAAYAKALQAMREGTLGEEENQATTLIALNEKVTDEMTEFWRSAARNMQQSMSGLFFDVMQGNLKDLSGGFKRTVDKMVADVLAAKAATALFGADFGKGGSIGGLIGKGLGWFGGSGGGALSGSALSGEAAALGIVGYASGTDYVPRTGPYMLHQGEAVTTAAENRGGRMNVTNVFNISGATDRRSQAQIAAAAGAGVQRAMARNT